MTIEGIIIAAVLIGLVAFSVIGISKEAGRVHGMLDSFMAEAVAAKDLDSLNRVMTSLIEYANKNCGVRPFGDHARQVIAYIQGKRSGMNK